MTRECATCGGDVHYVDSYTERRRNGSPAVIHNYRCRGDCRAGGFVAEKESDGSVLNKGGPAFEAGRFRHAEPERMRELVVADGGHA